MECFTLTNEAICHAATVISPKNDLHLPIPPQITPHALDSCFFGHPFISKHFWQFSSLNWQVWMAEGAAWGGQVYRRGLSSTQTLLSSFSFLFQHAVVRKQTRYHSPPTSWCVTAEIKQETKIWQTCEDLILTYGIVSHSFESYNSRPTCSMRSDHLCSSWRWMQSDKACCQKITTLPKLSFPSRQEFHHTQMSFHLTHCAAVISYSISIPPPTMPEEISRKKQQQTWHL